MEVPMFHRSRFRVPRNRDRHILSFSQRLRELALTFQLIRAIRVMEPAFIGFSCAGIARAQGTMDFSGAQTLMTTFNTT
jgi:hypothetical protein